MRIMHLHLAKLSVSGILLAASWVALSTSGCAMAGKKSDAGGSETSQDAESGGGAKDSEGAQTETPEKGQAVAAVSGKNAEVNYKTLAQAVRSGNSRGVTEETSKLLAANSSDPVALNALALMYMRRAKPGAAKLVLNRAIEKNAGVAGLYNNLGVVFLEENDPMAAVAQFKKALKLDDRHAEASANLGSLYASGGDYARARPLLEQAYKANRANMAIANNYAIALRVSKDLEGARRVYEEATKSNSRDATLFLNYAILLIDYLNKPKEGLDIVYKVEFMEPDKKDVLLKANALEKKAKSEVK